MGCCVSCRKGPCSDSAPPNQNHGSEISGGMIYTRGSRASPLMEEEEETVKEVLSVTPTPKPVLQLNPKKTSQKPVLEEIERDEEIEKIMISNVVEEISEVSDICSLSESFSAATVTGKTDESEEVNQKLNGSPGRFHKNQSFPSGNLPKRNPPVGKSPTGRSDQSPARRPHGGVASVKIVPNRDSGGGMARRNTKAELQRRDPRENSARRSRSPSTARIEMGANRSSAVRSGRSPGRAATTAPPEHTQKETEEVSETDVNCSHDTTNESLENPLVSLECFIFL